MTNTPNLPGGPESAPETMRSGAPALINYQKLWEYVSSEKFDLRKAYDSAKDIVEKAQLEQEKIGAKKTKEEKMAAVASLVANAIGTAGKLWGEKKEEIKKELNAMGLAGLETEIEAKIKQLNPLSLPDAKGISAPKSATEKKTVEPAKTGGKLEGLKVYDLKEIGDRDIFPGESKDITPKVVSSLHERYERLRVEFNQLAQKYPAKADEIKKITALIDSGLVETGSQNNWQYTVNIRANDAVNMGLREATYITAQEGLYCFHEGYIRVMTMMLAAVLEDEKKLSSTLDYELYLNPQNKESYGIKTAWFIENGRKGPVRTEPKPEPKPAPTAKPEPEPKPALKPEPKPEPEPKPKAKHESEPKPEPKPEPENKSAVPLLPPKKEEQQPTKPDVPLLPPKSEAPQLPPKPEKPQLQPKPEKPQPQPKPEAPQLPPGKTPEVKMKKLELVVVDVEEKLKRISERLADERLDQEMKEIGPQGWKQLWRLDKIAVKWWKRNAMEGYREKYQREILQRLRSSPKYRSELMNLAAPGGRDQVKEGYQKKLSGKTPDIGVQVDLNQELDIIAQRFGVSWEEKNVQYLTNESIRSVALNDQLSTAIKNLCKDYVAGNIDAGAFKDAINTAVLPAIKAMKSPSNQELIAFLNEQTGDHVPLEQRRGLLDKLEAHKKGLIRLDLDNFRLALGRAQNVDVKTEVKDMGKVDKYSRKFIEALQRNRFLGRFLSPSTVAVMGYGLANVGAQLMASHTVRLAALVSLGVMAPSLAPAIAGIAAGTLLGAGFGYFRKNKEILQTKAQKERRSALNYQRADDQKGLHIGQTTFERELEQKNALYQKKNAGDLARAIDNAPDNPQELAKALAEAITRNELSEFGLTAKDRTKIDLISFDSEMSIEKQRWEMTVAMAKGRVRLRNLCQAQGLDENNTLQTALVAADEQIKKDIALSEKNFRRVKRIKTLTAAGIGGLIGGSFSALSAYISYHRAPDVKNIVDLGSYKDRQTLIAMLKQRGFSDNDLNKSLVFDDKTGRLTARSLRWLKENHIDIQQKGLYVPGYVDQITTQNLGIKIDRNALLDVLQHKGINVTKLHFNADGTLDKASLLYLKNMKIDVHQVTSVIPGAPGKVPGSLDPDVLKADGFNSGVRLHFNGNDPTGRTHLLDELRFFWKSGKPQLGADGYYHFSARGVLDPHLTHSNLPAGVNYPASYTDMQVGLQITHAGKNYWKFFTPDANGEIRIPPEYFSGKVGAIARGGSVLPGLRTTAMAFGFKDKNGVYQILSSARGKSNFIPNPANETVTTFDVTSEELKRIPSEQISNLITAQTTVIVPGAVKGVVIPVMYGDKMHHLEYGEQRGKQTDGNRNPDQTVPSPAGDKAVDNNGAITGAVTGPVNESAVTENALTTGPVVEKTEEEKNKDETKNLLAKENQAVLQKYLQEHQDLFEKYRVDTAAMMKDTDLNFNINQDPRKFLAYLKRKHPMLGEELGSVVSRFDNVIEKDKNYLTVICSAGSDQSLIRLRELLSSTNMNDTQIFIKIPVYPVDNKHVKASIKLQRELSKIAQTLGLNVNLQSEQYSSPDNVEAAKFSFSEGIDMAAKIAGTPNPKVDQIDLSTLN